MTKNCVVCGRWFRALGKQITCTVTCSKLHRDKRRADTGVQSKYRKRYRERHPERVRAANRAYRASVRERYRAMNREWMLRKTWGDLADLRRNFIELRKETREQKDRI